MDRKHCCTKPRSLVHVADVDVAVDAAVAVAPNKIACLG